MGEDGDPDDDNNARMILRATATGPRGTTVTVARILSRFTNPDDADRHDHQPRDSGERQSRSTGNTTVTDAG